MPIALETLEKKISLYDQKKKKNKQTNDLFSPRTEHLRGGKNMVQTWEQAWGLTLKAFSHLIVRASSGRAWTVTEIWRWGGGGSDRGKLGGGGAVFLQCTCFKWCSTFPPSCVWAVGKHWRGGEKKIHGTKKTHVRLTTKGYWGVSFIIIIITTVTDNNNAVTHSCWEVCPRSYTRVNKI